MAAATSAGVEGALVVHHNFGWLKEDAAVGFDHSYVHLALQRHPAFFRGMAIVNPALGADAACASLDRLASMGFCAVRFNPATFEPVGGMGGEVGMKVFAKAGELGWPVGFMCFRGIKVSARVPVCPCVRVPWRHLRPNASAHRRPLGLVGVPTAGLDGVSGCPPDVACPSTTRKHHAQAPRSRCHFRGLAGACVVRRQTCRRSRS